MQTVLSTQQLEYMARLTKHKRTDIPLLNLNPLMTKNDKRWFRSKFAALKQMQTGLEAAAYIGLRNVLGDDWYHTHKALLASKAGTCGKDTARALHRTIVGLCQNTAHTFMCQDTFFALSMQKHAVFEVMAGLRRKHPLVDVRSIMNDVYLEHGDAIDRVRNRKVLDARLVSCVCTTLSKSDSFKEVYNTYRGECYGVSGSILI